MTTKPNPISVLWSIVHALRTVRPPRPTGSGALSHEMFAEPLQALADKGPGVLGGLSDPLERYLAEIAAVDPDTLDRPEALAMWINVYNAGALRLAGEAQRHGKTSVLRVPGGFRQPFITIAGEALSLDDIEHAKLRRFGDPRIHAALVCGSVSCPTLRGEPYRGRTLSDQLDDQTRNFLAAGGCVIDRTAGAVHLSRVFLWFGSDFARPDHMPSFLPVPRRAVLEALVPWLTPDDAGWVRSTTPKVGFQKYDWGLSCSVR